MKHGRQIVKELKKIKEELEDALKELEFLNIDAADVNIKKALNIVIESINREEGSERKC